MSAARAIADLRELAARTSNANGAQRMAWGPGWRAARAWLADEVAALGLRVATDAAGNNWVTLTGRSPRGVIVGSHLDSVADGGWLDGALGIIAGLEVLRAYAGTTPAATIHLVDWADEEGRFGLSLLGSSAAAGTLDVDTARRAIDRDGGRLVDALAENGVELERMLDAHPALLALDPRAYLELHIEQGPVLAASQQPAGVVIGTFGIERHVLTFSGQAAHAGSTPIAMRRDAFLAAAQFALECRAIATRHGTSAVCTVGRVAVEPNTPTVVPGRCTVSLDQRALDPAVIALMLRDAQDAAGRTAGEHGVSVEWHRLWRIEPRAFDPTLIALAEDTVRAETGGAPRLPSGPVHDASQMAALMPTVMLFVCSPNGLSHCKDEDTPEPMLERGVRAFLRLVEKVLQLA